MLMVNQNNCRVGKHFALLTRKKVPWGRVGKHGVGTLDGGGRVQRGPRVGDEIHVGVAVVVCRRVGRRKLWI